MSYGTPITEGRLRDLLARNPSERGEAVIDRAELIGMLEELLARRVTASFALPSPDVLSRMYVDHGAGQVTTQTDGGFSSRPMTVAELAARLPAAWIDETLDDLVTYRAFAYIRAWEQITKSIQSVINTPEIEDFLEGARREAAHQVERWGIAHDRSKSAEQWYFLVGYLSGKALRAHIEGDRDKALHHAISTAAALFQWHKAIKADQTGRGLGADADLDPEAQKQ